MIDNESVMNEPTAKQKPSLWQVAKSVLAAFLGVQSDKNYQRDFNYGKPSQYIVLSVIGVALFVFVVIGVVKVVMHFALG